MIIITIPGNPVGKQRPRFGKGFTYTPKDTVNYENWVRTCFLNQEGRMLEGELKAEIICYYSIPKSASKKKAAAMKEGNIRPIKKPDLDNIAKIILDSLNGMAYKDDSQIVELSIKKYYGEQPLVRLCLEEIDARHNI